MPFGSYEASPEHAFANATRILKETGAQAIAKVVAFCGHPIPGVLVTGDTAPERLREAAHSGYAVLHKPVRPGKLRALLLHLLDVRPTT